MTKLTIAYTLLNMWRIIVFILLFPFNSIAQDALLEAMFKNWNEASEEVEDVPEYPDSSGPEFYSWELGTRDDIPETIVIYDKSSGCDCW